jgi:glutamine synthetase adenylyltransferase
MTTQATDRARRTTETDRWLAGMLGAEPGVALVAVGGYGRKELLPGSDLDVLLLHDGREDIAKFARTNDFNIELFFATITVHPTPAAETASTTAKPVMSRCGVSQLGRARTRTPFPVGIRI